MSAERVIAATGAERHGIVRTDLLLERGVSLAEIRSQRRAGRLVTLGRGVDRLRDHPFSWLSRCRAALDMAGPDAALGLRTAGRLHGWYADRDREVVEVLVPRGRDHRTELGRIVQTTRLPASHVTEIEGMRVTTPARTFFDRCGDPDGRLPVRHGAHTRAMIRLYNDALRRGGLTFTAEVAVLSALAGRGRRGTRLVRKILKRFSRHYKPTDSDTETTFLELVIANDLPAPEKHVAISGRRGFIGVVDFLWRDARHIVEIDSSWHDGPLDTEVDEERDKQLRAAGYSVDRYRYEDLVLEPTKVLRELGAAVSRCSR